ncbi:MAG: hypothetical protein IKG92_04505 [Bacteroidales bacterium]|nr:hypothetical protein [Bacteroidales bacterium]
MEFKDFILAHDGEDLGRLALARGRYAAEVEDFDLALTTLEARRKLRSKVPEWYAVPSLRYPLRVSGEQCSSAETARYKAAVAVGTSRNEELAQNSLRENPRVVALREKGQKFVTRDSFCVADLTGGLGVDAWAFAQVASEVLYNEMRPELADAARQNFAALGLTNVQVCCKEVVPGNVASVLGDFRPDVLFLDPARRSVDGRKVFRLEDCQPDVLQLLPELLAACPRLLLKLSPMADITLVCKQLACVKDVHVVAAEGECKELLLLLERNCDGPYGVTVYENGSSLQVDQVQAGSGPGPILGAGPGPGDVMQALSGGEGTEDAGITPILFEPGKALLKAGAFDLPCQYGLEKLGRHTHLYVGEEVPEALRPFGKVFRVLESAPLDKRSLKDIGTRYPRADVTARNIPLTSDQLRKKLGMADGGPVHIFGVRIDALSANYLLVCSQQTI